MVLYGAGIPWPRMQGIGWATIHGTISATCMISSARYLPVHTAHYWWCEPPRVVVRLAYRAALGSSDITADSLSKASTSRRPLPWPRLRQ